MAGTPRGFPFLRFFGAALLCAGAASAQNQSNVLSLPLASSKASVTQTVGVTDIAISYHRPLVKGRKIWGALVPYGAVWRAGANQNTTISFSDPVAVEGQALPAGTYGLHMIPDPEQWTVIFSKNSTSWGSFTYDKAEDALRVKVKPVPAPHQEALLYEFDDVSPEATVATLRWAELAIPVHITVDTKPIVLASIRKQLRSVAGFTWAGWNDAAIYCLENKTDYDEALKWIENSIQAEERFENLETKARILFSTGKVSESAETMERAVARANVLQLHFYGRRLIAEKKPQQAMKIFETNAKRNPQSWVVFVGLARGQVALGDYKAAAKSILEALALAPENQKPQVEVLQKRIAAREDINS